VREREREREKEGKNNVIKQNGKCEKYNEIQIEQEDER
jgi:hypothetical protein